ncbi:MAG: UDP-N-acetylmuramoyl-tripeptide--D-alanyl-D-alanine ligase, partial [Nitrospinota bacterium]
QLFVALRGEHHDGHAFLGEAFAAGAAGAVVDDEATLDTARNNGGRVDFPKGAFLILVEDTLQALQALARFNRSRYPVPLVAITGSNGKTTVKEMTAACLATVFTTLKNEASHNNHIGLPLTLVHLGATHEVACMELGMNHPGEIAALSALAKPLVGVVTNVGEAHLEFLKTVEGVQAAKGELIEALPPEGIAVLNADDPLTLALSALAPDRVVTFGLGPGAEVTAEAVEDRGVEGVRFTLVAGRGKALVSLPAPGAHSVVTALAAAAAAWAVEVPVEAIPQGLAHIELPKMRMERTAVGGWTVINDAYNANPDSTRVALMTFVALKGSAPGGFCFGEMRELGPSASEAHAEIGRVAVEAGVEVIVTVGPMVAEAARAAEAAGLSAWQAVRCEEHAEAAEALRDRVPEGGWILVKGSRGSTMERVVEALAGQQQEEAR